MIARIAHFGGAKAAPAHELHGDLARPVGAPGDVLEGAFANLDESDPQHDLVRFELATQKAFRRALREFPEVVTDQEDDS